MRILEDTFTILHIKIAHIRIYKFSARTLVTLGLIAFIVFGILQIYLSWMSDPIDIWGIIESLAYVFIVSYMAMFWLISWPEADRLLSKSSDIDSEGKDKKDDSTESET